MQQGNRVWLMLERLMQSMAKGEMKRRSPGCARPRSWLRLVSLLTRLLQCTGRWAASDPSSVPCSQQFYRRQGISSRTCRPTAAHTDTHNKGREKGSVRMRRTPQPNVQSSALVMCRSRIGRHSVSPWLVSARACRLCCCDPLTSLSVFFSDGVRSSTPYCSDFRSILAKPRDASLPAKMP